MNLDYNATDTILFNESDAAGFAGRRNLFYQLEPFGTREMHPYLTTDALTLLPVFNLDDGVASDNGGELWIGVDSAVPGELITILFQVVDGTANALKNMTTVRWYYLAGNNWLVFDKLSIDDRTNNLTRSGIVTITLPASATLANTRADTGLLWIKAAVDHDPDAVCKLVAVRANAAKAQFKQDLAAGIEFATPIAPNAISKPTPADAAIKKTDQPYPSFDGRPHETDDQFYLRVSERLRHKHRAITPWDYERLVLQYYPQIHKVKCLNHTGLCTNEKTNKKKYSELLPGHVMVVTVPQLDVLSGADLLHPYTSVGLLQEIHDYLATLDSPFVQLHLCNPQFEEVEFDFEVSFVTGDDPVFYANLLNQEIIEFLTPWGYGGATDIEFGGVIEKSVVLNFIVDRDYVDYVTCFTMNQYIPQDDGTKKLVANLEEAQASTARSILVSYAQHNISSPAKCDCDG
jgi:hypothetical protein